MSLRRAKNPGQAKQPEQLHPLMEQSLRLTDRELRILSAVKEAVSRIKAPVVLTDIKNIFADPENEWYLPYGLSRLVELGYIERITVALGSAYSMLRRGTDFYLAARTS